MTTFIPIGVGAKPTIIFKKTTNCSIGVKKNVEKPVLFSITGKGLSNADGVFFK